jgi:hypothetical protein
MIGLMRGPDRRHCLSEAFKDADLAAVRPERLEATARLLNDVTGERGAVGYGERMFLAAAFRVLLLQDRFAIRCTLGCGRGEATLFRAYRPSAPIGSVCIWSANPLITFRPNLPRFAIFGRRIKVGV